VNVVSLLLGIVLLILLSLFVTRTDLGLSMRAAAEDLPAAQLMGIDINRVIATAFAIGSGLAAVAGLLFAVQAGQLTPYMGFTPVLKAFIAAVIGGFGSISGAIVGGYALGGLEVLLTAIPGIGDILPPGLVTLGAQAWLKHWLPSSLSSYRDAFVFVVLILVLLFRPNGILGRKEREELG
jgi:branched-chain amino acid transport system permease protein